MRHLTVLALRVVVVLALAGSLAVQVVLAPLLWVDLEEAPPGVRAPVVAIFVLGLVTLQVCAVCVWRLLTMVRREEVFTPAAFRWVDVIVGAIAAAAVLALALGVVLAPGEAVAPGVVLLIGGAALVLGGIALVVLLLRLLLAQAVDRDTEARQLRDELDEVI
ncbi:DUF2975 domain-containing protein [Cellulomonas phragmiteti]|uniref:Transporter n=1 Tax=Cellulomonas phragmiteti TaxID=478780 RepID=A0ABQ4DPN3_9CELL|nr:DUF2975 domain-containing protein [Cellulomonas phragmiteti]GIG41307.1 transporter [Cellulomonas phragmiteti]